MRGGGSRERYDSAGKTLTTQLNARLPPGNLLTCTFLLDRISSSGLRRLLNQHVGGNLKKVLPRAARTELEIVFFFPVRHRTGSVGAVVIPLALPLLLFIFHPH